MAELVTRHDLEVVRNDLEGRIAAVRTDLEVLRCEVESSITSLRNELESSIDRLSLRLTVPMGAMLAAAIAVLATINRL